MNVKTTSMLVTRIVGLTLLLFILFSIDFLGLCLDEWALAAPFALLLMCFLDVIVLSYPIIRSRWTGFRLVATIFFVFYGEVVECIDSSCQKDKLIVYLLVVYLHVDDLPVTLHRELIAPGEIFLLFLCLEFI